MSLFHLIIIISYSALLILFLEILKILLSIKNYIFSSSQIFVNPLRKGNKKIKLPKVNLVVICRNEEKRLSHLLNSDLSFFNKIILINDNSKDRTFVLMKNYKRKLPHKVNIFENPTYTEDKIINSKAAALEFFQERYASNSEYIFFCDADISFFSTKSFFEKLRFKENIAYTFMPKYKVKFWWEKVWLPLFLTLCFLEYRLYISTTQVPILGFAWMISQKKLKYAFSPLDIKGSITEDYVISKNLLKNGVQIKMIDGSPFLSIKCYEDVKHFFNTSAKGYQQLPYLQRFFIFLLILGFNLLLILNFILLIHSLFSLRLPLLFLTLAFYSLFVYLLSHSAKWIEMKKSWLLTGFLGVLLYLTIAFKFILSKEVIWRGRKISIHNPI